MDQTIPAQNQATKPDDMELLIQQMAAMGISPEVMGMISHQMNRGESLQDTPMAQGRQVGNTYVASSPLEHLSTAMRKIQGSGLLAQNQQNFARQLVANQQGLASGGRAQQGFYQNLIDELRRRQAGTQGTGGPVDAPQQMPDVPGSFP